MKKLEKIEVSTKDAIHLKCGECCGFDWIMIVECTDILCPLHLTRPKRRRDTLKATFWDDETQQFIARPVIRKRTKVMTEEQKKAASERFKKMHLERKRNQK